MDFVVFDNRTAAQDTAISADFVNQNRGFLFGDGFFTTGKIKNGRVLHLDLHLNRIVESLERLQFTELDTDSLKLKLLDSAGSIPSATFRLTITRTQKQRGYAIAKPENHFVVFQVSEPLAVNDSNIELSLSTIPASQNSVLAGIKHLNRLENVLASNEVKSPNHEVILCCDEKVISASKANLFLLIDGTWCTPDLRLAGVKGIMRELVLRYFEDTKTDYQVREISISELKKAKAAFVTNCIMGVRLVERIETTTLELNSAKALQSSFNGFLSQVS